jgi:TonB family protein
MVIMFFLPMANGQGYESPHTRMSNNLVKQFINTHIEYPEKSIVNKEEGTVFINFNLDKRGNTSNIRVTQSVSRAIDSAALHLFRLIIWSPAKNYGKAVESESYFKIKYKIKHYQSLVKKRGYESIPVPIKPSSDSYDIFSIKELDKAPEALLDSIYDSPQDFIAKNLQLPEAALKLNLTGVVKLRFIIESSGLPSNIMVIEPLGGGCTEEAIRVVQLIKWMPGIKNHEAVRTCYNLTLNFDPADEIKSKHIPNQSNTGI